VRDTIGNLANKRQMNDEEVKNVIKKIDTDNSDTIEK